MTSVVCHSAPKHASDCALNNAPASAPGPCSCGASTRFRMWGYDITRDVFAWTTHSRESLITEVISGALARCYGRSDGPERVGPSTLVSRAVKCGLTSVERAAVADAWLAAWDAGSFAINAGHLAVASAEDGRYFTPDELAAASAAPDEPEIAAAMAPWIEFWATLPEPVVRSAVLAA